mgnify:CR=1 FL=1|tara:strand:+ start:100 stop:369 length:270 start_codon:yes stop_codon:yes gene_type:complete
MGQVVLPQATVLEVMVAAVEQEDLVDITLVEMHGMLVLVEVEERVILVRVVERVKVEEMVVLVMEVMVQFQLAVEAAAVAQVEEAKSES